MTIANTSARVRIEMAAIGQPSSAAPRPMTGSQRNGRYPLTTVSPLVSRPSPYAPRPKNAAWPSDGYPAKPPTRFQALDIAANMTANTSMLSTQ